MECRKCGACCVALSISSDIPGMPGGKPAGVPCPHLTGEGLCAIYGRPERPRACLEFRACEDTCGGSREEAMRLMEALEKATRPSRRRFPNFPGNVIT